FAMLVNANRSAAGAGACRLAAASNSSDSSTLRFRPIGGATGGGRRGGRGDGRGGLEPGRQALRFGEVLSRLFGVTLFVQRQRRHVMVRLRMCGREPDRLAELCQRAGRIVLFQLLAADPDRERRRLRVRLATIQRRRRGKGGSRAFLIATLLQQLAETELRFR